MYSLYQIAQLKKKSKNLKLIGCEMLNKFSNAELQHICNGIGAAWFPKPCRLVITKIYTYMEITAFNHDLEYHLKIPKKIADMNFLKNGMIEVKYHFKWHNIKRYHAIGRVVLFYLICLLFGSAAYNNITTGE